ncbi:MAG: septum formation initiator family protein [Rhodobacteraceae bacterium]|nr:septum formation initiator family protein [Paracoccaceae bacterium]
MKTRLRFAALARLVSVCCVLLLGGYFAFAALQGEYGIFRRIQIDDEAVELRRQLEALNAEVAEMQNKTLRMSDDYLDFDLLDERARTVLRYIRMDEIALH